MLGEVFQRGKKKAFWEEQYLRIICSFWMDFGTNYHLKTICTASSIAGFRRGRCHSVSLFPDHSKSTMTPSGQGTGFLGLEFLAVMKTCYTYCLKHGHIHAKPMGCGGQGKPLWPWSSHHLLCCPRGPFVSEGRGFFFNCISTIVSIITFSGWPMITGLSRNLWNILLSNNSQNSTTPRELVSPTDPQMQFRYKT